MTARLRQLLEKRPLVYVTRDIERALGCEPKDNYIIISNKTPYAEKIQARYPENIWLIASPTTLDTHELLSHSTVIEKLKKNNVAIVVFKNTLQIEEVCKTQGFTLLNPSAEFAKRVEEKISQIEWLGDLGKYLPPFEISTCKDLFYERTPFILQFNHGHTGGGTLYIDHPQTLEHLKQKFPNRLVKKSDYIQGPVYTQNIVVGSHIIKGNISLQITGLTPFTDLPFSTIGNDYGVPENLLTVAQNAVIEKIGSDIGEKLQKEGWKGLFGIDIIVRNTTGEVLLLEINARQPASTTFESQLQQLVAPASPTIFEAHLLSLLDADVPEEVTKITEGAQIVQRITAKTPVAEKIHLASLEKIATSVITYTNTEPNTDLVRIQLQKNIMKDAEHLNAIGTEIANIITS